MSGLNRVNTDRGYQPSLSELLDDQEQVPRDRSLLLVMNHTGDSRFLWDRRDPHEVEAARELFNSLKQRGYTAYLVKDGNDIEVISYFEPNAKRIVFAPPIVGG